MPKKPAKAKRPQTKAGKAIVKATPFGKLSSAIGGASKKKAPAKPAKTAKRKRK